jgi:hypothetical protein
MFHRHNWRNSLSQIQFPQGVSGYKCSFIGTFFSWDCREAEEKCAAIPSTAFSPDLIRGEESHPFPLRFMDEIPRLSASE